MAKVLIINTSNSTLTKVGLEIGDKRHWLREKTGDLKSQNLLPLINKILEKYKLNLKDLTAIEVETGAGLPVDRQGSFTGLRVGVSVANALGWALRILVNGKKQVEPSY